MSHEDFNQELNALRENLPTAVEETAGSKTAPALYTIDLATRIVDFYAQGYSLHWISRQNEMPNYTTLLRWSKSHPELSKMLRAVREARALHFEDKAIETAENAQGKDADRLKFEAYKWGAEVNDPTTYGKKVEHKGEIGLQKVVLNVVTGFGPLPPALQFPKLNADGTICKEVKSEVSDVENASSHEKETQIKQEAQSVPGEAVNGPGNQEYDREADAAAGSRGSQETGLPESPSSSVDLRTDGVSTLQSE